VLAVDIASRACIFTAVQSPALTLSPSSGRNVGGGGAGDSVRLI
jgi:hypothetical protein